MKSIGKTLLAVFLSFLAMAPLSAFEAGAQLLVSGGAAGNGGGRDDKLEWEDDADTNLFSTFLEPGWWSAHHLFTGKLVSWFDLPFVEDGSFGIAGQASLKYGQEGSPDEVPNISFIADIDLLRYYYNNIDENGAFVLSAGRFNVTDKTSTIINQKLDGLYLGFNGSRVQFGAYVGYTGLLNSKTTMIINSSGRNYWTALATDSLYNIYQDDVKSITAKNFSDFMKSGDLSAFWNDVGEQVFTWADPYILSSANVAFPYLFANQTPYIEATVAVSTEGPSKIVDEFDRFYLTGGMYGPFIFPDFVYNISTTFSTCGDNGVTRSAFDGLSNLTKLNFTYFTNFHSLTFSGGLTYASGDNGIYDPFYGFTSTPISYMRYSPEHSAAVKYGLSASFKPVKEFLVTLGADQVFDYQENVIDYMGWQWYTEIKLQCTSDFQFQVKAYRFIAEDTNFDNTGATVTAVFSF